MSAMSDIDTNPTPLKKRKRAAPLLAVTSPHAFISATNQDAETVALLSTAAEIPLDPIPSDIVIDSTWKNLTKFETAIKNGLRLKDPVVAPAAADEVPETATEDQNVPMEDEAASSTGQTAMPETFASAAGAGATAQQTASKGQDGQMEDQAASGVNLTAVPDTSASATTPVTLPQIWDWENAPTVPLRKFVVVEAKLMDARRKAAGVNAVQLKVWSITVKDEHQKTNSPFEVYGADAESISVEAATVLAGGALDEVICADQAEALRLGAIVCGLLDRLPFYISWEEWHNILESGKPRVRYTILRRLVQARALDLWRPSLNRLSLPESHRELQLGIQASTNTSNDSFNNARIAQSVRVFFFDLPPLVYTTTSLVKKDLQIAKRTVIRIIITYRQLDIEKVNALPDVPSNFAYKFAPPGPLTPERQLLLKAFHTIQYRLTFKSGTQLALEENAAAEIRKLSKASIVNRELSLPKSSLPKIQTDTIFTFARLENGLRIMPAPVARHACTGELPRITVYHRSGVLAAYVLNKVLMMRAEGRDLRNIWQVACLAADLVSKSLMSLDVAKVSHCKCGDSTDRSTVRHICMICFKAFPCQQLLLTQDRRRICQSHPGADDTGDQPITIGLYRIVSRMVTNQKPLDGVDTDQLKAKLYSSITDSEKHKWQDAYVGERSTPDTTLESTLLQSYMSPFQPSIDAVHRFIMVDSKAVQHHQDNVVLTSLCLNFAKNKWGVHIIAVLGTAARQTQKERNGEARDQKIWDDIHNSMDRLHRLSMQVTPLSKQWVKLTADQIDNAALESWHDSLSSSVWEPGQPSPVPGYKRGLSTAGDEVTGAEIKSGQIQRPTSIMAEWQKVSAASKTVIPTWFEWNDARKKRLSTLIDEMQNSDTINPGNKVKLRRSDTGAPWPFRGDHEFTGDSDLWDWLFREMFCRFWRMFWLCNVRHDTVTESPDTILLEIIVQYFRNGGVDSFIHCEMTPFMGNPFSMSIGRRDSVAPGSPMITGWTTAQPVSLQDYDMNRSTIAVQPLCINLFWSHFDTKYHQAMFEFLCSLPPKTEFYGKLLRFTRPVEYPRESRVSRRRRGSTAQDLEGVDEGIEEELQQEAREEYGIDRTDDPIDVEESDDDEMDGDLPEKVQFLRDALRVLRREIEEADPEFLEMAECRAWLDGMRHASRAGDEALFDKLRDELVAFVQSRQEKASVSNTETCCVCKLLVIEGSMLRCSNAEHANAVFHFTCLNEEMPEMPPGEPTALCPACQSKDHDANAGFHVADDGPKVPDGENDNVPCDQCSQTFKDSAALTDHTKETHSKSTPDALANPAITQILRALRDSQQKLLGNDSAQQQGQIELQRAVSAMQQGLQQLLDSAPAMQTHQLGMKADIQQIQRELQQQHLEMKDRVQRMQDQQETNFKRLQLKVLQQQRERNEEFVQGLEEHANEKKHAEERLRERAVTLKAKCQPSEREIKLLDELEEL